MSNPDESYSAISIQNLSKSYIQGKTVLENLNLDLEKGNCFGLLGNNGAGKSTLINILVDILQLDDGTIFINGIKHDEEDLNLRSKLGVLPESEIINPDLTGFEQMDFTCLLYGLDPSIARLRIDAMQTYFFDESDDLNKRCGSFSTGMKKKLGIMSAFIHKPDIIILDEPFSGLDPGSAKLVINFINAYKTPDRTFIISSHNLSYIDQVATHIGVIHNKNLAFSGKREEFTHNGQIQLEESLFHILKSEKKNLEDLMELFN